MDLRRRPRTPWLAPAARAAATPIGHGGFTGLPRPQARPARCRTAAIARIRADRIAAGSATSYFDSPGTARANQSG